MSFLIVQDVRKSYGPVRGVERYSLSIERGEIYSLVGPDGAGKTTLIRMICGLLKPDAGRITIDDLDNRQNIDRIKPLLGYMPQQFSLYPDLSVEENLSFYAGIYGITGQDYRRKRDRLYEFSNLGPFAKRRASALSGGMKQKLALSCALAHDPQLLILDEPTTGVDPLSRRQFWEILLSLKRQGVAIVVSTPYMDEVARVDRASFIFLGRKLAEDTPGNLATQFDGQVFHVAVEPTPELVDRIDSIEGIDARRFGAGLHLYLPKERRLEEFFDQLQQYGLGAQQIAPIKPSLEDRFIQLMERLS